MADILTELTSMAVSVFRERMDPTYDKQDWSRFLLASDPVLQEAQSASLLIPNRHPVIADVTKVIFADPEFSFFGPIEGKLDPMLLHPRGGSRMSPDSFIRSLLSSALLQIFYLRLPLEEGTFVRTVLEGFEELRRAVRGEQVRAYFITGYTGISLSEGLQVATPWGVLRSAPPVSREPVFIHLQETSTTCILAQSQLVPVVFDRSPQSEHRFDPLEPAPERAHILLPLASALASPDSTAPAVPVVTWYTFLFPFQPWFGYSMPVQLHATRPTRDISEWIVELEEWARVIEGSHSSSVDIAARRIVSAVAHRIDQSDTLIDAVMAWENLVGTSVETTFRVTAALAKALEPDRSKRRSLRKSLASVYDVRSKVIHGTVVERSSISEAATQAVDIAIRALRFSYKRGQEWLNLSSNERTDTLLLEEP